MIKIEVTFLVTYYAHPELLDCCIDSIKKFYPDSKIIVSQQIGDDVVTNSGFDLIHHNMETGVWADAAIGLLKKCETDIAVFMEHDCVLLKDVDQYLELIRGGEYDLIGPEEVIPLPCLDRDSPGMITQNFFMINAKKMKEIGLDKVAIRDEGNYSELRNKESGYGISQSLDKKLFVPVTASKYAYGTYYGDFVHHLWYGSYRKRPTYQDGVEEGEMELESIDLINDYWSNTVGNNRSDVWLPTSNIKRKYAVLLVAHKEKDIIGLCIKQWRGLVDKILVLYNMK